jgi:pimeloyl-ACP methyl ester carboxylesterase
MCACAGAERRQRAAADDVHAGNLRRAGLPAFLDHWYSLPMWESLRGHPAFPAMLQRRGAQKGGVEEGLGFALAAMSPGRAPSLWGELGGVAASRAGGAAPWLLMVAGERDAKFAGIARRACELANTAAAGSAEECVVKGAGHAVHVERPLELLVAMDAFLNDI